MKQIILYCTFLLFFVACKDKQKEDVVNEVPKNGSIETNVKVEHLNDSLDLLITEHKVWKNPSTMKSVVQKDTIPSLGTTTVKDDKDVPQIIKKEYDIYITVK